MIAKEIEKLRDQYCFPSEVHTILSYSRDRVISDLLDCIALFKEFFQASLQFPFHPFFRNILDFYELAQTQLIPNSVRIIVSFIVLYHIIRIEP